MSMRFNNLNILKGVEIMAKMDLFNILKVTTSFIINNNSDIHISLGSAKEKGMVVALGDNQLLKFIRQIQNKTFDREYIKKLYSERNQLRLLNDSKENSQKIIDIQRKIETELYVPELISVKVDTTKKDYKNICKNGFRVKINVNGTIYNTKYTRLCAGAGQLRRNSAFFVNEEIYPLLEHIMMCGLSPARIGKINLAKFSAYFALYTSSTQQVTTPNICVINDYEYTLKDQNIKWIYDNDNGEKDITNKVMDFNINAFDGSGIISPEMAQKWQSDLELDYLPASFILRSAWIKGLVSVFDFKKFAKEVAKKDTIIDMWGNEHKVEDIDVILTKSQFKMAKKYESFSEYIYYHKRYNHIFGVARVSKRENNIYTPMNYQYLQTNNHTNESIKSLADFSLNWLQKIMSGDKLYAMLFLLGTHEDDEEYSRIENSQDSYISKTLMYNDTLLDDTYVRNKITNMIDKKIKQMKIGRLLVEGSYDFMIPDLYALCEHAFGMDVNGLLEAHECWNKRWVDKNSMVVAAMRSPLVDFSENQKLFVNHSDKCKEWFQYIYSGNILNIKDMTFIAMSDADTDGDICLSTDNEYVVNAIFDNQPTITYEKTKAKEQRLNMSAFATMDTRSFNTKIGFITNIASSLIAMLSSFPKESDEYKEIKRRISLLRFYQGSDGSAI